MVEIMFLHVTCHSHIDHEIRTHNSITMKNDMLVRHRIKSWYEKAKPRVVWADTSTTEYPYFKASNVSDSYYCPTPHICLQSPYFIPLLKNWYPQKRKFQKGAVMLRNGRDWSSISETDPKSENFYRRQSSHPNIPRSLKSYSLFPFIFLATT